jgi:hypothetical protein
MSPYEWLAIRTDNESGVSPVSDTMWQGVHTGNRYCAVAAASHLVGLQDIHSRMMERKRALLLRW